MTYEELKEKIENGPEWVSPLKINVRIDMKILKYMVRDGVDEIEINDLVVHPYYTYLEVSDV
jgi:hypothetical protein